MDGVSEPVHDITGKIHHEDALERPVEMELLHVERVIGACGEGRGVAAVAVGGPLCAVHTREGGVFGYVIEENRGVRLRLAVDACCNENSQIIKVRDA